MAKKKTKKKLKITAKTTAAYGGMYAISFIHTIQESCIGMSTKKHNVIIIQKQK